MTKEEAEAVARVIGHADGGCGGCVADLAKRMTEAGIGWEFTAGDVIYEPVPGYDFNEPRVTISVKPSSPP